VWSQERVDLLASFSIAHSCGFQRRRQLKNSEKRKKIAKKSFLFLAIFWLLYGDSVSYNMSRRIPFAV